MASLSPVHLPVREDEAESRKELKIRKNVTLSKDEIKKAKDLQQLEGRLSFANEMSALINREWERNFVDKGRASETGHT